MSAATEREREEEHEQQQSSKLDSLPEIVGYLTALGDTRAYTIMLFRTYPTKLADGTKCSGRLKILESPAELNDDSVREEFGGGEFYIGVFKVGEKGIKKRWAFGLPGVAKLPAHMLGARQVEAAGNGTSIDTSLGGKALDASIRENDRHAREREERDREIRRLAEEKAKAEAENIVLKAQLSNVQAQPGLVREERSAERAAVAQEQAHSLQILQAGMKAQADAAESRAKASEMALEQMRSERNTVVENATKPFTDYLTMLREQSRLDQERAEKQHERQMELERVRAANALEIAREENKRLREEMKGKKDGFGEFASQLDVMLKLVTKLKGDEEGEKTILQSVVDKLGDPAVMQQLPGFLVAARHLLAGGAAPNMPPLPPAASATTPPPQAGPPPPSPEQQQMIVQVVAALKDGLQKKIDPTDIASYIVSAIGIGAGRMVLSGPVDQIIAQLAQADPVFADVSADAYIREVYASLRKTIK